MARKRPCLGCGKAVEGARCPSCQREANQLVAARRKAWGQRTGSTVSPARRRRILDRDGWRCHICKRKIAHARDAHIDHVHPRSAGGSDADSNLAAAHRWCNQRKGAKT